MLTNSPGLGLFLGLVGLGIGGGLDLGQIGMLTNSLGLGLGLFLVLLVLVLLLVLILARLAC